VSGPVHCIAQSDAWLAIGSGKVVQLVKQATIGALYHFLDFIGDCTNIKQFPATWERVGLLPDPPKFPELEAELPEPMARSLHFLGGGSDVLLVTYLDHGVMCAFCLALPVMQVSLTINSAWNLTTLEIKWRIRPRSCKMYGLSESSLA